MGFRPKILLLAVIITTALLWSSVADAKDSTGTKQRTGSKVPLSPNARLRGQQQQKQRDVFFAAYQIGEGIPRWIWLTCLWSILLLACTVVAVSYVLGAVFHVFSKDIKLSFEKPENFKYDKLEQEFCDNPMRALKWSQGRGLLRKDCPLCYQSVNPEFSADDQVSFDGRITCPSCMARVQFLDCSWFDPLDIDVWKAIGIMHHWAAGVDIKTASKKLLLDDDTTASWYMKCMEVAQCTLQLCFSDSIIADRDHYRSHRLTIACPHYRIGGPNKVVEFKIAKKNEIFKNYAVVVAIERDSLRNIVLPTKVVSPRGMLAFIKERVLDGTKIMSRYFEDANVPLPAGQYKNFHVPDAGRPRDKTTGEGIHLDTADDMLEFLGQQLGTATQRAVSTPLQLLAIYSAQFAWRRTYLPDDDSEHDAAFQQFLGHVRRAFPVVSSYYDADVDEDEREEEEEEEPVMPSQAAAARSGAGDGEDDDDEEEEEEDEDEQQQQERERGIEGEEEVASND
ncbi:unnamed protein product [Notodromas monacha]|uniref:Uncharacterized protein n=1 Tax=Notodromas monacha TaxID=399045 RepID=A0A7R9BR38_9CRUS|nr:unnamed protein product [Notodromas monacha]CAG0919261.1 unnamed protein product [Notodromas monacha]